jgi:hypothetical protein
MEALYLRTIIYVNVAYELNAAVRLSAEYLHVGTQFNKAVESGEGSSGQVDGVHVAAY